MAVIRRGEIVACDSPAAALDGLAGAVWEAAVTREEAAALKGRLDVISTSLFQGRVRVRVLARAGRPGEGFAPAAPTLEDYYFGLVARAGGAN
jgi:hypothetical protein